MFNRKKTKQNETKNFGMLIHKVWRFQSFYFSFSYFYFYFWIIIII